MSVESKTIWFDGKFVPFEDANVHVLTHTLHYGLGAFEGIRAYQQDNGKAGIWRLDEHLQRFADSMKMIRLKLPYDMDELRQACCDVLRKNDFTEAYLRPLAFMGAGKMGLGAREGVPIHVAIAAWKWGAYLGDEGLNKGIRLKTASLMRNHPNATLSRGKIVGHYVNSILARYDANDDGFDEALMLDFNGFVAEGTGENVFVVGRGQVKTPPIVNILPGITRRTVMEILDHEGIVVKEQFFGRDAFYVADEAFMCGTAAEITPVREVDYRAMNQGAPGPITQIVKSTYLDAVRGRVDWLRDRITLVE